MDWSLLPSELWSLIYSKLDTAADQVRFRAVSRDFRSFPFYQPICLILPEEKEEELDGESLRLPLDEDHQPKPEPPAPRRRFIVFGEQQIHHLDLPEAHEKRCVCSAGSWLVTVDMDGNLCLLNPFTRRGIELPSQGTLPGEGFNGYDEPVTLMNGFLRKVVFSSLDFSNAHNRWIAMAIYHSHDLLAICKAGDISWTVLRPFFGCHDIIFFRQQFFIIDALGVVSTYNIDTGNLNEFSRRIFGTFMDQCSHRWYLVEWMGELLVVKRIWPDFPSPPQKTFEFLILKRDFVNNKWVELNNLGDHCLFIGLNTSTCIPISNGTAGSLERNCVYFSSNRYHPRDLFEIGQPMVTDDIGVYSVKDRSVRYFYDGISSPSCSPAIWVIPTLDQQASVEL